MLLPRVSIVPACSDLFPCSRRGPLQRVLLDSQCAIPGRRVCRKPRPCSHQELAVLWQCLLLAGRTTCRPSWAGRVKAQRAKRGADSPAFPTCPELPAPQLSGRSHAHARRSAHHPSPRARSEGSHLGLALQRMRRTRRRISGRRLS